MNNLTFSWKQDLFCRQLVGAVSPFRRSAEGENNSKDLVWYVLLLVDGKELSQLNKLITTDTPYLVYFNESFIITTTTIV